MSSKFIHLRVKSSYSLGKGAMKIDDIIALSQKNRMPAVALTDNGNLYGALEFSLAAQKVGLQPITGVVLKVKTDIEILNDTLVDELLLLASGEEGFKNLLDLVSSSFLDSEGQDGNFVTLDKLKEKSAEIICLAGYSDSFSLLAEANNQARAKDYLRDLQKVFSNNLYIEIVRAKQDVRRESFLLDLAVDLNIPIVASNDVYFADDKMHEAQDILSCISTNRYYIEEDRVRLNPEHYFKSSRKIEEIFSDLPEAIENSCKIAKKCSFFPQIREPMLPSFKTEAQRSEVEELRHQAQEGLKERMSVSYYDDFTQEQKDEYQKRLDYELEIIAKMGFPGYFLIVSDFIKWSKDNNIPVGPGRGSGAGSIVAWSLQITELDPLRFGLLFERFLNPQRVSMPDFDIDFCQERRDEVIRYVRSKYGKDKVASIITFGKLQAKAVLKDVGRVLQMPYKRVDEICKMIPFNPVDPVTLDKAIAMDKQLRAERDNDPEIAKLLDIGLKLEGLHRHTSTHAAGIVIGDRSLVEVIPLYKDPRSEMPVVQYSMKYTELAGLVKFDFLGLKTLTTIAKTVGFLKEQGITLDINSIALDDAKSYELLSSGNAVGVFQLESAGMRDCLKKMRPDKLEDIIALISLYRPGPMDNIPDYIARKHGQQSAAYPHPLLKECLEETFGVIIYQEQVMQIAQILGGYSLGDADLLRRAMGKKIKAEMDAQREIFVNGALKNDIPKKKASEIFDLVAKFAGYGFNKSHAAAYALIGYHTAYLKANYPVEFMAATMNMDIHDTDKINFLVQEVKRMKIKIVPPCVNNSEGRFSVSFIDGEKVIVYGLVALKAVGRGVVDKLVEVRGQKKFSDIYDFVERCGPEVVNKRVYESLVNSGALDSLGENRHTLFAATELMVKYASQVASESQSQQVSLFADIGGDKALRPVLKNMKDYNDDEYLRSEFLAVGFYLTRHPLDDYKKLFSKFSVVMAQDFAEKVRNEQDIQIVGVIINHRQRSGKNGRFSTVILSDPTAIYEISIFDEELIDRCRGLFVNGNKLFIKAYARVDEGGVRIMARDLYDLDNYLAKSEQQVTFSLAEAADLQGLKGFFVEDGEMLLKLRLKLQYKDYSFVLEDKATQRAGLSFFSKVGKIPGVELEE